MRSVVSASRRLARLYPSIGNVVPINQRTRFATLLFPHVKTEDELLPDLQFIVRVYERFLTAQGLPSQPRKDRGAR